MSVEDLLTTIRRDHPERRGRRPSRSTQTPSAAVSVAADRQTVYADAYTGRVLGERDQGMRAFMSEIRAWHRWLSVEGEGRPVARAITGWSNAVFLFIVCSGFYLWFPRKWTWQRVRPVVLFSGKPSRQGTRLQLAQRHRALVLRAALHRRAHGDADLVPVGERARLSRCWRGTAAAGRTWRTRRRRW